MFLMEEKKSSGKKRILSLYQEEFFLESEKNSVCMKVKQGKCMVWLLVKINLSTTLSMKRSRRELSIDMVPHSGIYLKKNTLFSVLPSYLRQGLVFTKWRGSVVFSGC